MGCELEDTNQPIEEIPNVPDEGGEDNGNDNNDNGNNDESEFNQPEESGGLVPPFWLTPFNLFDKENKTK